MTLQAAFPRLPVELLTDIITCTWNMPLSSQERLTLTQSCTLVNSTWAGVYALVSARDVYITSATSCARFLRRLNSAQPVDLTVRSLTVQITAPDGNQARRIQPMGAVLVELLDRLDVLDITPSLSRLAIQYLDARCEDLFRRHGLATLPPSITHLELRCSFTSAAVAKSVRKNRNRQRSIRWHAPSITHLSVFGAGETMTRDMLEACPNTTVLEVDASAAWLFEESNISVVRCQ